VILCRNEERAIAKSTVCEDINYPDDAGTADAFPSLAGPDGEFVGKTKAFNSSKSEEMPLVLDWALYIQEV